MFHNRLHTKRFPFSLLIALLLLCILHRPAAVLGADTPMNAEIPEAKATEIGCSWSQRGKGRNPPKPGDYQYNVLLPAGYHESAKMRRRYPLLVVIGLRGGFGPYQRWLAANNWVGVSLNFPQADSDVGRSKGSFLAAVTDAQKRFRLERGVMLLATQNGTGTLAQGLTDLAGSAISGIFMFDDFQNADFFPRLKAKPQIMAVFTLAGDPEDQAVKQVPTLERVSRAQICGYVTRNARGGASAKDVAYALNWLVDRMVLQRRLRRDPAVLADYLTLARNRLQNMPNFIEQYELLLRMQSVIRNNPKLVNIQGIETLAKDVDKQLDDLKKDAFLKRELMAWEAYRDMMFTAALRMESIKSIAAVKSVKGSRTSEKADEKRRDAIRQELRVQVLRLAAKYLRTYAAEQLTNLADRLAGDQPVGYLKIPPLAVDLQRLRTIQTPPKPEEDESKAGEEKAESKPAEKITTPILKLATEAGETLVVDSTKGTITGKGFVLKNCSISNDGFAGDGWKDGKSFAVSGKVDEGVYKVIYTSGIGRAKTLRTLSMKKTE